jgi:MraZ protein
VARFFGSYEHALDPKGRVVLPFRFRSAFEQGAMLSAYLEGCLALWTPEEFDRQLSLLLERAAEGPEQRNLARVQLARSYEVAVDRQGRLPIPQPLREFARLESVVLVHGANNRVELWDPATWETKVLPAEQRLLDGAAP